MEQRLKERLIGACVLVALAVWLIPWLLDGAAPETGSGTAALELPAAEESVPLRTVSIDLDDSGRPALPAGRASHARDEHAGSGRDAQPSAAPSVRDERAARTAAAEPTAPRKPEPEPEPAEESTVQSSEPEPAERTAAAQQPTAEDRAQVAETAGSEQPAAAPSAARAAGDWAVQLGAFGEAENAERLAVRVKTFGYEPDVSTYTAGGRDMHRVRVGPQPSRARAEAVASALSAQGFVAQVVTTD